ncbi:glycosyl hydrolase family 8 [Paenibacillus alvei]|uniref:Glycosyl hydrolase family 8 n=1 Tax=Paenibacillus alvei TaxID=44250 RepID=A0ABT4H6S2_PAEAL|nr:glycosyl hydrolase family 8 [Paenibacillus alvei]EJW16951.1 putative lipoprotein YdaJ [Paenibacillus alvei DSM 29]MCY9539066.1 glycosyl hydrolase family 8 [Paenibacillus alvei]MCY9708009.1 glycosyl hydrolase family 8 [Paenibacillus alvei]MCY9734396.1 glycosyl hydrolase family 8 [Paenibacillus alvei]MCY9753574.1 glycosyl hydrolase family 8 [Paenibacillus alvei]
MKKNRIRSTIWKLVGAVLLTVVIWVGAHIWMSDTNQVSAVPLQLTGQESPLMLFVTKHMMSGEGGIFTNLRDDLPESEHQAANHQMLSESTGLMLLHAVQINNRNLFDNQFSFLQRRLLADKGYIRWRYSPRHDPTAVNAAVDDLRIARALLEADREWGIEEARRIAKGISKALLDGNVSKDYMFDHYDWKFKSRSACVTMSYMDIHTMGMLAAFDKKWETVRMNSLNLMKDSSLGNGLFRANWNPSTGFSSTGKINMIDSLYTALYLAEEGEDVSATIQFLKQEWSRNKGKIPSVYAEDGSVREEFESPSVYALAVRLLQYKDEHELAEQLKHRMYAFAVQHPSSPNYGGFVEEKDNSAYSFDQLQVLLTEINPAGK